MIAAASSDTPYQSPDYSSQQPIHASATNTSLASSTAYAETPASSTQQTASIIVPLRSVTPLSDVDEDLQRIIAEDYTDGTSQIAPSASLPPATSEPTSSSLRSPEALSSFSASVQPLYTAQSPAAQTSLNVASPVQSPLPLAALPAAAASPAASSVSADTGVSPTTVDSRWRSLHTSSGSRASASYTREHSPGQRPLPSRSLMRPAANSLLSVASASPHEMPLHQLLRQLMPVWRAIFDQHRR